MDGLKSKFIISIFILSMLILIGFGEDYVNFQGVPAKELSNMNISEMKKNIGENDLWMLIGGEFGQATPSQRDILNDRGEGDIPKGYPSRMPLYIGAKTNINDTRNMQK